MDKDLYRVLGVSREAGEAEIKSAYRKLAKELHPDRNKDNPKVAERFKEVSSAYSILGDKEKRARYDRGEIDASGAERHPFAGAGAGGGSGGGFGGFGAGGPGGGSFEFTGDPEDLFSDLFGFGKRGRSRGGRGRQGANINYRLTVGFLEAISGTSKRVTLKNSKTLDVKIPAGVRDGQQIRLSGQGEAGVFGGAAGDAIVTVRVAEHPYFRREGDDIILDLPITIYEATLGTKLSVPTVDGKVTLTIPRGSSSGRKLRLKGKGVAKSGGARGDQYVVIKIIMPPVINDDFEARMETLAAKYPYDVRDDFED